MDVLIVMECFSTVVREITGSELITEYLIYVGKEYSSS